MAGDEVMASCKRCGEMLGDGHTCPQGSSGMSDVEASSAKAGTLYERFKDFLARAGLPGGERKGVPLGGMTLVDCATDRRVKLSHLVTKIGRDVSCHIAVPHDKAVSREHAQIVFQGSQYFLEDLGSTNGTFLNGKRLGKGKKVIMPGDKVGVGQSEFTVVVEPASAGEQFGGYEIVGEIGRGGMGVVYEAVDLRFNRRVAIKKLTFDYVPPEKRKLRLLRFSREASVLAALNHPNIVAVYDVKLGPDVYYFVMELLEGNTLRQELALKGGKLSPQEYLPLLEQVVAALAYAHRKKLVHRDVKPDNVFLLEDRTVKLGDFGIARPEDVDSDINNLTRSGAMLGTLNYVSPEQLNNAKRVDHRSDIFSLGVVSYEALSGRVPFRGEGIADTVGQIISHEEVSLERIVPEVTTAVASCISRCLKKKPAERYDSVDDFLRDYKKALAQAVDDL